MLNNSVIVEGHKAATAKIKQGKIKGGAILGPAKIGNFVGADKKQSNAPTIGQNQISFLNDFHIEK